MKGVMVFMDRVGRFGMDHILRNSDRELNDQDDSPTYPGLAEEDRCDNISLSGLVQCLRKPVFNVAIWNRPLKYANMLTEKFLKKCRTSFRRFNDRQLGKRNSA